MYEKLYRALHLSLYKNVYKCMMYEYRVKVFLIMFMDDVHSCASFISSYTYKAGFPAVVFIGTYKIKNYFIISVTFE